MPNTVKYTRQFTYVRGSASEEYGSQRVIDVSTTSGRTHGPATQLVGTTEELLQAGDMTDDLLTVLRNIHATQYIEVGLVVAATFYPLFKIPAGEEAVLPRLSAVANVYVKGSGADTELNVLHFKIAS